MISFEAGRRVAAMIPNARFVPLESKSHVLLPHEKACAAFQQELHEFLHADEQRTAVPSSEVFDLIFTPRENELLNCIARGLTNVAISRRLKISEKAVRNHLSSIFLQARCRASPPGHHSGAQSGLRPRLTEVGPRPHEIDLHEQKNATGWDRGPMTGAPFPQHTSFADRRTGELGTKEHFMAIRWGRALAGVCNPQPASVGSAY